MLCCFAATFGAGFFEQPPNLFLMPLGAFGFGAVVLMLSTRAGPGGPRRGWAKWVGSSALVFVVGLVYGAGGFWWDYEVNDVLFVGGVIVASIVYLVSTVTWWKTGAVTPPLARSPHAS